MRTSIASAIVVWSIAALGCSGLTPLTDEMRSKYGDETVSGLQCYASDEIVLRRVLRSEEAGVTAGHKLKLEKGKRVEEVVIAAATPGVILKAEPKRLLVSFEPPIEGKDATIVFQIGGNGRYYMFPTSLDVREMNVDYGGKSYTATDESRIAHLVIEEKKISRISRETRIVPGRRVGDSPEQK